MNRFIKLAGSLALAGLMAATSLSANARDSYRVAWTIYAGSIPLAFAQDKGILKQWGDKYGFDLEAVQLNDYMEAQTQFTAGQFDAVIAISLDALTIPAASGVDTTAITPLSTSLGSDGIIMRGKNKTVADLKGKNINLVELSGSHYMLDRALATVGMSEKDVNIVNTSDADIGSVFASPDTQAVATWKPQLSVILEQNPDSTLVFDSSDIPGEIMDVMAVHTETLKKNPDLAKAINGAWFEVVAMFDPANPRHKELMDYAAAALQTSAASVKEQLSTLKFYSPESAAKAVQSDEFRTIQTNMTQFAFDHGLFGDGASDPGFVGIELGNGHIIGSKDNVKLRFPTTWTEGL